MMKADGASDAGTATAGRGGEDDGPDMDGLVRVRALAYGFTPKAIIGARHALRSLLVTPGVSVVALDVGRNHTMPRTRLSAALVADVDAIRESMGFCTLALPAGDLHGNALELSLACAMTTVDTGARVRLGPPGERDPAIDRRLAWALGPMAETLMAEDEIPHGDLLGTSIATVVCSPSARWAAAREVAARLALRRLPFMSLDRSLAIVRRGAAVTA